MRKIAKNYTSPPLGDRDQQFNITNHFKLCGAAIDERGRVSWQAEGGAKYAPPRNEQ